jgi:hypothetical protein
VFELVAGVRPFAGMMHGEIIHKVVVDNARPHFPAGTEPRYVRLAKDCWAKSPQRRPTFEEVAARLEGLMKELGLQGNEKLQVLVGDM